MALVEVSGLQKYYLKNGKPKFEIELSHNGLNRHKVIKGDDPGIVSRKAEMQLADWEERWEKQEAKRKASERKEQRAELAEERTTDAAIVLSGLEEILAQTLQVNDAIDWNDLKDRRPFPAPRPQRKPDPSKPLFTSSVYQPKLGFLDWLIRSRREAKRAAAVERFEKDSAAWEAEVSSNEREFETSVVAWEKDKKVYDDGLAAQHRSIDEHRERYLAKEPEAILEYCDLVLSRSE